MSAAYDQLRSEPSVKVTIAACQSVDSKGYEIFFFLKFVGLYEKNLQQQTLHSISKCVVLQSYSVYLTIQTQVSLLVLLEWD